VNRVASALLVVVLAAAALAACQGNVFSLKVGDCFTGGTSDENVSNVSIVDCSQPHDGEIYSVFDYPNAPSAFPGDGTVTQTGDSQCAQDFATYVGIDWSESSIYSFSELQPSSDSWGQGDRTIDCVILSKTQGQQLTGSAKGTAK
jgi:hypothetical protein